MAKKQKSANATKKVFKSMKNKLRTNPGHGYPHESVPGSASSGGSTPNKRGMY